MLTFFVIAGLVWLLLAMVLVLSLAAAASRSIPSTVAEPEQAEFLEPSPEPAPVTVAPVDSPQDAPQAPPSFRHPAHV